MPILLEQDDGRFSLENGEFGQYDKKGINTSKFNSEAYYQSDRTVWNELDIAFSRGVIAMSKNKDHSTSFESYPLTAFKRGINEYMGSREYVHLDSVVIVKTKRFDRLLSLEKAVDLEIDKIVEKTAMDRSTDDLKYDLSTVIGKLKFDDEDLREIQRLVEDGDF